MDVTIKSGSGLALVLPLDLPLSLCTNPRFLINSAMTACEVGVVPHYPISRSV